MKVQGTGKACRRVILRSRSIVLGAALMLSMPHAGATIPVVEVGGNLIQSILNQLNTLEQKIQDAAQYAEEKAHWLREIQHYSQQLIAAQSFLNTAMARTDRFEMRALDYGMEEECPNAVGLDGVLSNLWNRVPLDYEGDITRQQARTCGLIVMAKNERYNNTIRLIQKLRSRDAELMGVQVSRLAVGTNEGMLAANDNDISRFMASSKQDLDYWQASNAAYDSYIETLTDDQRRLAKAALAGKRPSAFGTVVQGIWLSSALRAARQRDR